MPGTTTTTDTHAHWLPPGLVALLRDRRAAPRIAPAPGGDGEVFVTYLGRQPFTAALGGLDARVAAMGRWGIGRQAPCCRDR